MTSIEGVDYSFQRPVIASLAAAGKQFACRYVGPGSSGKHLTTREAESLTRHGIAIVANAEGEARGLLGGAPVGAAWARDALAMARVCGMPAGRPIYLSIDFDMSEAQWPAVRDALAGAASVLGVDRVGVYGGLRTIALAHRDGAARWLWQTYAWSGGRWFPPAHIRQYRNGVPIGGGVVDLNLALVSDFGQWGVGATSPDPRWTERLIMSLPVLRKGSSGPSVRRLQGLLAAAGFPPTYAGGPACGIDGSFGGATEACVRSVQAEQHLTVDAVVGRHTWSTLLGYGGK